MRCHTVSHTLTIKYTQALQIIAERTKGSHCIGQHWHVWSMKSRPLLSEKELHGQRVKKKMGGEEEPYASCSGLIQMLYKGHKMVLHLPGGVKGRNNIPQAAELKITLLRQIPSLTVLPRHKLSLSLSHTHSHTQLFDLLSALGQWISNQR